MDKRFQVFVSSTYEDLQEERREVMQALLELDCIPAGMELFPASNDDQWSLIKKVIDDCDYYIVIIGGRYGSTNSDGRSYTEMEYRYAAETNKPIIAFLHKKPEEIKAKFTEETVEGKRKLEEFRKLAENKVVRYWGSPSELGSVVSRSMIKLIKTYPAIGWIKADETANEADSLEILKLREENKTLKDKIAQTSNTAPAGTEKFAQGEDQIPIQLLAEYRTKAYVEHSKWFTVETNWNKLFAAVAPYLTNEADEETMRKRMIGHLQTLVIDELKEIEAQKNTWSDFSIPSEDFQRVKIQFKALGLIEKSAKGKSIRNTKSYWTLTPYGDHIMTQLIAVRKPE